MCFSPAGDFDTQIREMEKHVKAATICNDADSKWTRKGQAQAFSSTPDDKCDDVIVTHHVQNSFSLSL
ncbi:hypothetical protein GQ54DRAFT_297973 [Martensiomyces pterosporus]|nr:hypothetical protein GQ54DRAFT_297973 [Martensiomyces pterosporus]